MLDVFISYSRKDRDKAAALADSLNTKGYSVWWDQNLVSGSRFREVIESKLQEANKIVVLWSKHSIVSSFVIDEAQAGKESGKLIPLSIDVARPPLGFRDLHTIALRNSGGLPAELVAALEGRETSSPALAKAHARWNLRPPHIAALAVSAFGLVAAAWFAWSSSGRSLPYAVYDSAELGFHIAFPEEVLDVDSSEVQQKRILLRDRSGQAAAIASRSDALGEADARLAQQLEKDALLARGCTITYEAPQKQANWSNWFVVSGVCGADVYYLRRWYAGGSAVAMEFNFPKEQLPQYESIVPRMIDGFRFSAAEARQESAQPSVP
ncbi:MAG: toll/interleukin-1 receptor domain-containing protein [Devosia sp.]